MLKVLVHGFKGLNLPQQRIELLIRQHGFKDRTKAKPFFFRFGTSNISILQGINFNLLRFSNAKQSVFSLLY